MKKLLLIAFLAISASFTSAKTDKPTTKASTEVSAAQIKYYTGPRGGCYYINSKGNKTYVDRKYCK